MFMSIIYMYFYYVVLCIFRVFLAFNLCIFLFLVHFIYVCMFLCKCLCIFAHFCVFLCIFLYFFCVFSGWIALLGAVWLLVLSDTSDFESVLHKIEWATLVFFAALFVLMEVNAAHNFTHNFAHNYIKILLIITLKYCS